MTEHDAAALHTEFAGRLNEAVARRDAELSTLDRGYSAILATQTPDLAAAHDRYAAARGAAALRHAEAISNIQYDYAQDARFGAPPLPAVAPARERYPAPSPPGTGRRAAASSKPGRTRGRQSSKAAPFGKKPTPVWRIAAMSVGGTLAVVAVLVGALFAASTISSRPATESASSSSSSGSLSRSLPEVLYEVEGSAAGADITYATSSGIAQQSAVKVPLTAKGGSQRGIALTMDRGDVVSISAQNRESSGSLTCRITVDGVVISTVTSSGAYTIATCSGSVP